MIQDRGYEMSNKERAIYEHSLTEREVEMSLKKQTLRRKLRAIEDLQPGETPVDDVDLDYSRIDGK